MVIAPISAPVGYVAFIVAASGFEWPFNQTDIWLILVVASLTSYLGLFLVGVPILRRLSRSTPINLSSLTVIGAFSGILVMFALIAVISALFGVLPSLNVESVLIGASLGSLVAFSYGVIAGPRMLG